MKATGRLNLLPGAGEWIPDPNGSYAFLNFFKWQSPWFPLSEITPVPHNNYIGTQEPPTTLDGTKFDYTTADEVGHIPTPRAKINGRWGDPKTSL